MLQANTAVTRFNKKWMCYCTNAEVGTKIKMMKFRCKRIFEIYSLNKKWKATLPSVGVLIKIDGLSEGRQILVKSVQVECYG